MHRIHNFNQRASPEVKQFYKELETVHGNRQPTYGAMVTVTCRQCGTEYSCRYFDAYIHEGTSQEEGKGSPPRKEERAVKQVPCPICGSRMGYVSRRLANPGCGVV